MILAMVIFHFKHFFADYPLQTPFMLGKFKKEGWVTPLAAHCGVHALFTLIIVLCFGAAPVLAFGLALIDFTIHFIMDRVKASPNMLGRYEALSKREYPEAAVRAGEAGGGWGQGSQNFHVRAVCADQIRSNRLFWIALGFDQLVHGLTDLLIVALLFAAR